MEGRGVTNYGTGKPCYGFSTMTTEFDDALMSRGVVTFEQAMLAKGAQSGEARRLALLHLHESEKHSKESNSNDQFGGNHNDGSKTRRTDGYDDASGDNENDENFMARYRQMRIDNMKGGRRQDYGEVIPISRPDWNREVNEASRKGLWVVVNLTRCSASSSRTLDSLCDKIEEITKKLAEKFFNTKFVSIPFNSAIENWPAENLPTLFCYRYGKMQHQLVGIDAVGGKGVNIGRLEWRLAVLGVLVTDLDKEPAPSASITKKGGSYFDFKDDMSRLATRREHSYCDYDDVD